MDRLQRLERLPTDIPVRVTEERLQRIRCPGSPDLAEDDSRPAPGLGFAGAGEIDQGRRRRLPDPPERLHHPVPGDLVAFPEGLDERPDGGRADTRKRTGSVPPDRPVGVAERPDERHNRFTGLGLSEHPRGPPANRRPLVLQGGYQGSDRRGADTDKNSRAPPPGVLIVVAERLDTGGDRQLPEGRERIGGERPDLFVRIAEKADQASDAALVSGPPDTGDRTPPDPRVGIAERLQEYVPGVEAHKRFKSAATNRFLLIVRRLQQSVHRGAPNKPERPDDVLPHGIILMREHPDDVRDRRRPYPAES